MQLSHPGINLKFLYRYEPGLFHFATIHKQPFPLPYYWGTGNLWGAVVCSPNKLSVVHHSCTKCGLLPRDKMVH